MIGDTIFSLRTERDEAIRVALILNKMLSTFEDAQGCGPWQEAINYGHVSEEEAAFAEKWLENPK